MKRSLIFAATLIAAIACEEGEAPEIGLDIGFGGGTGGSGECVDPPVCDDMTGGGAGSSEGGVNVGLSISLGSTKSSETLKMRDSTFASTRPNQLVISTGNIATLKTEIARLGFTIVQSHKLETISTTIVKIAVPSGTNLSQVSKALAARGDVSQIQSNYVYEAKASTNASLAVVGVEPATGSRASGTIAIIDGMVDTAHADLKAAGIRQTVIAEDAKATKHGTAVASLLIGNGNIKGVAQGAKLLSFVALRKESGASLKGESFWIAEAVDQAAQSGAKIISLSLGNRTSDNVVKRVIDGARGRGILVVASAGNGGSGGSVSYPAGYASVVGITAVDGNQKLYRNATTGDHVDYASLGVNLLVAAPGGYDTSSGTSMATAIFAGTLLGISNEAGTSPAQYLASGASSHVVDLGSAGKDASFGHGLLVK